MENIYRNASIFQLSSKSWLIKYNLCYEFSNLGAFLAHLARWFMFLFNKCFSHLYVTINQLLLHYYMIVVYNQFKDMITGFWS